MEELSIESGNNNENESGYQAITLGLRRKFLRYELDLTSFSIWCDLLQFQQLYNPHTREPILNVSTCQLSISELKSCQFFNPKYFNNGLLFKFKSKAELVEYEIKESSILVVLNGSFAIDINFGLIPKFKLDTTNNGVNLYRGDVISIRKESSPEGNDYICIGRLQNPEKLHCSSNQQPIMCNSDHSINDNIYSNQHSSVNLNANLDESKKFVERHSKIYSSDWSGSKKSPKLNKCVNTKISYIQPKNKDEEPPLLPTKIGRNFAGSDTCFYQKYDKRRLGGENLKKYHLLLKLKFEPGGKTSLFKSQYKTKIVLIKGDLIIKTFKNHGKITPKIELSPNSTKVAIVHGNQITQISNRHEGKKASCYFIVYK